MGLRIVNRAQCSSLNSDLAHLAYVSASGAALLAVGALSFLGARRTVSLVQRLSIFGVFLALFVGIALQGVAASLVDAPPYNLLFRPTDDLRAQALMENDDLRTRYNTDGRLRFIPTHSDAPVINLEAAYHLEEGPFRSLDFPELIHGIPVDPPAGVASVAASWSPKELRQEVAGLYESAESAVGPVDSSRADFARDVSIGFLLLGLIGIVGGIVPLVFRAFGLVWDGKRLLRATSERVYRGVRGRALRSGMAGLAEYHFRPARPFGNLAVCGLLIALAGLLMGLVREDEVRRQSLAVFREARHLRIDVAK